MTKITAVAPTRIDLAGGTLDLWPLHQLLERKATINIAVNLPAQVEVTARDGGFLLESSDQNLKVEGDWRSVVENQTLPLLSLMVKYFWPAKHGGIHLKTSAKSPAGAGLGGSSCLAITIIRALLAARQEMFAEQVDLSENYIVASAQDVEAFLIKAPTGCQDYWGAMRGGVNCLSFPPGQVQVETFSQETFNQLNDRLILCFSGKSRASAINNWEIFKRAFDGDRALLAKLAEVGALAEQAADAVRAGDIDRLLEVSRQEWLQRIKLWPNIETIETKALDAAAKQAGAKFSRVCGAGGGGVMAVFCDAGAKEGVSAALNAAGGEVLPAGIAWQGLRHF